MSGEAMQQKRVCLGVAPESGFGVVQPLLSAISEFLPVDFVPVGEACLPVHIEGVIVLGGECAGAGAAGAAHVPRLIFEPGTGAATVRRSRAVELRALPSLDPCLRGQRMEDSDVVSFIPLVPDADDEIAGLMEGQPFWLRRGAGLTRVDMVAFGLPTFGDADHLFDHFQPGRFARLLPLLQFIRDRVAAVDWDSGPFRACFVFDDPNLLRPRFGCLDFGKLVGHARLCGYHAAIALVPLRSERAGAEAVEIFRSNRAHLSLIIHGNDHTYLEMLNCRSDGSRAALLSQALRRIAAFERQHGIEVERIMEPSHGCVARAMFPPMAALGFEAGLTSFRNLLDFAPMESWPRCMGMDMAEVMPGGMAAIPRIRMLPDWRTAVVLAGFLRQPMVIAGHHQDAIHGLDLIAEFAQMAAGFGPVRWLSPAGIARSNFKVRREGSHLLVKTYHRRVSVPIPAGVDRITVERAWLADADCEQLTLESQMAGSLFTASCGSYSPTLQVVPGDTGEIRSFFGHPVDPGGVPPPPRRLWPVVRRFMTDTRDRCYPWFHRGEGCRDAV